MPIRRRALAWALDGTALVVVGVLYFVDLFLPWTVPQPAGWTGYRPLVMAGLGQTGGWGGAGTVAGVLVAVLVVWEATRVARVEFGLGNGHRSLLSAMLAFGVALFTAVNVAGRLTWMQPQVGPLVYGGTFLWISVALGVVVLIGGWLHWVNWIENAPMPQRAPLAVPPEPVALPPGTCPSCGRGNSPEASFCSWCGARLGQSPARRPPSRREPPPTPPSPGPASG